MPTSPPPQTTHPSCSALSVWHPPPAPIPGSSRANCSSPRNSLGGSPQGLRQRPGGRQRRRRIQFGRHDVHLNFHGSCPWPPSWDLAVWVERATRPLRSATCRPAARHNLVRQVAGQHRPVACATHHPKLPLAGSLQTATMAHGHCHFCRRRGDESLTKNLGRNI